MPVTGYWFGIDYWKCDQTVAAEPSAPRRVVGATLVVARGAGRHKTDPYDEATQALSI